MSKTIAEIAVELNNLMRLHEHPCFTLSWESFYALAERERLKDGFLAGLKDRCLNEYGLVFVHSFDACFVLQNRNFDPPKNLT